MTNRKIKPFLFIAILVLATLACNAVLPQTEPNSAPTPLILSTVELPEGQNSFPQTEADVPRVSIEEALAALNSGAAIIVDVRSPDAFANIHIAGAISIPLALIESAPANLDLDKEQWIITYCT